MTSLEDEIVVAGSFFSDPLSLKLTNFASFILLTVVSISRQKCYAFPYIEKADKISLTRQNLNSGLNYIFLCFKLLITHCHTTE